jgi:hypothetical protein
MKKQLVITTLVEMSNEQSKRAMDSVAYDDGPIYLADPDGKVGLAFHQYRGIGDLLVWRCAASPFQTTIGAPSETGA